MKIGRKKTLSKFDDMMKKKKHMQRGKFGGPHIEYLIILLDYCTTTRSFSEVYHSSGIRFKNLLLKLLRWAVKTELLRRIEDGKFVDYVITPFGRKFLKILQEFDKA